MTSEPKETAATGPDIERLVATQQRLLERALDALANVIKVAADSTAADAVEYAADFLNDGDAVEPSDIENWQRWVSRGRP